MLSFLCFIEMEIVIEIIAILAIQLLELQFLIPSLVFF